MIFNLVAMLLVIGITFLHSMFGLYSGLINVFCSIVAVAVSFGFYEPINGLLTSQFGLSPSYTEACTLILLFVVTLTLLRVLADQFMRGNVRVPMYVDWGGGAACGFINGQILIGVLTLGFLMLPFGGEGANFVRITRHPENATYASAELSSGDRKEAKQPERVAFLRHHLWLRSDEFVVGLFKLLSGGSLRGETTFASVYPNFPEWVSWTGNTVQHESLTAPSREKGDGFEKGLGIETAWIVKGKPEGRYRKDAPTRDIDKPAYTPITYEAQSGNQLLAVRVILHPESADRTEKIQPVHRFRPTMFRIVGDVGDQPREFCPQLIGGADTRIGEHLRVVDPDNNFAVPGASDVQVDLYFEVPLEFKPRFIEYRRHARVALTEGRVAAEGPTNRLSAGEEEGAAGAAPGGRATAHGTMRFIDTVESSGTGDIDRLPFAMSSAALRGEQADLTGNQLAAGRITADRKALEQGSGEKVERFVIPEGQRLFQFRTKARAAASLAGQVFNFVGSVVNQYQAMGNTGDSFPLVGYYAIVKRNGESYVELVYAPDDPSFRGMLDFQTEGIRNLLREQDDAVLGLLFLVPPGTCVASIRTQGGAGVDLEGNQYCVQK